MVERSNGRTDAHTTQLQNSVRHVYSMKNFIWLASHVMCNSRPRRTKPDRTETDRQGRPGRTGQRLVSPRLASLLRALPWLAAGAVSIRNVGQQFDKLRPTENRRRPQDFWQCPSLCSSYLMQRNANEQREPVANLCMLCCPVAIPSPATPPPPSLSLLASLKQLVALVFNMRSLRSSVLVDGERRDRGNGRGKA